MRTMPEIQNQIGKLAEQIAQIGKELNEYNKDRTDKSQLDFSRMTTLSQRNPIRNHGLRDNKNLGKKSYFLLLTLLLRFSGKDEAQAWLLLHRIGAGIDYGESFSELFVETLDIEAGRIEECTKDIIISASADCFAFDLILLFICLEDKNTRALALLGELLELVNLSKEKVSELTELAIIVAEQDAEKYLLFSTREMSIKLSDFFGYIEEFHQGILIFNAKEIFVRFSQKRELAPEQRKLLAGEIKAEKVELINVVFKDENKSLSFSKCGEVELNGCEFRECSKPIRISDCDSFTINECTFSEMTNRALEIERTKIAIRNSVFRKSGIKGSYYGSGWGRSYYYMNGGVMYLTDTELEVENSFFTDCYVRLDKEDGYPSGVIAWCADGGKTFWKDVHFENCLTFRNNQKHYKGELFMVEGFSIPYLFKNCKYTNSANNPLDR